MDCLDVGHLWVHFARPDAAACRVFSDDEDVFRCALVLWVVRDRVVGDRVVRDGLTCCGIRS